MRRRRWRPIKAKSPPSSNRKRSRCSSSGVIASSRFAAAALVSILALSRESAGALVEKGIDLAIELSHAPTTVQCFGLIKLPRLFVLNGKQSHVCGPKGEESTRPDRPKTICQTLSGFFRAAVQAVFQRLSGFFRLIAICQTVSDKSVELETPDKADASAGGLGVKTRDRIGW